MLCLGFEPGAVKCCPQMDPFGYERISMFIASQAEKQLKETKGEMLEKENRERKRVGREPRSGG